MVNVVAVSALDAGSSSRAQIFNRITPYSPLLLPAILLGMLRIWSFWIAPRHDVYFTAEALLIIYACFAIVRAVHVHARSIDSRGHYDATLARAAQKAFYGEIRRHWVRIGIVVLTLLVVALNLDMLTTGTGAQYRANVHFSLLFIELMVWLRYGSAIILASALWTPPLPAAFSRARELASEPGTGAFRLLAPANMMLCAAALIGAGLHSRWLTVQLFDVLPGSRFVFILATVLSAGLALLALSLMCRGSLAAVEQLRERPSSDRGDGGGRLVA